MSLSEQAILERARQVRALVLDVDGVLTDGKLLYLPQGPDQEAKSFHCHDGLGLRLAREAGWHVALLTGRRSTVVERRARELDIPDVLSGAFPKLPVFEAWCQRRGISAEQVAYMGDDLVDVPVLRRVGLGAAVADAHQEARRAAIWVSNRPGGAGAVRELVEYLLHAQGRWDELVAPLLA